MAKIKITNPQQIINGGAKKYYFKVKGLGGPKGDQGVKGDPGPRGIQGEPGNAATVYVGSTTTLPVGQDATVENVGTQYNAVLNFGIPQGPRGPQGIQGERGEPGQKGDPGPRGIQGEKGTNATVYIGTTTTLNPGSQATVYNSGTENNAVLNFGIPRGEKGETGATGAPGQAGQDGQNFTPTIVDSLPTTGNQSNLYLTPKAHTTQTATGNPITATVAEEEGAIESFQLDGNTTQQTYTGKNLFNLATPGTNNGVTVTANADGSFTLNGTTTGVAIFNFILPALKPAGTYTISCTSKNQVMDGGFFVRARNQNMGMLVPGGADGPSQIKGDGTNYAEKTFISTDPMYCLALNLTTTGVTYNNMIIYPQVEAGSTATSFEPYVGGVASPNPTFPQAVNTVTGTQTVEVVGKNLFDINSANIMDCYYFDSGKIYYAPLNPRNLLLWIACEPSTTYSITVGQKANLSQLRVAESSVEPAVGGSVTDLGDIGSNLELENITTSSQARYIVIRLQTVIGYNAIDLVDSVFGSMQIEKGTTATAYAPYSKHTYPINLGKNLFDKSSATILDAFIDYGQSSMKISNYAGGRTTYIKCQPNTTYTVSKMLSARFVVATTSVVPANNVTINQYVVANDSTSATITTDGSANYLAVFYYNSSFDTSTPQQILDTLQFEAGSTATSYAPYFTPIELCKLGDYQDYIYKDGESWKVHKATGKVDLSSIAWESGYFAYTLKRSGINPIADMLYVESNQQVGVGLANGFRIRKGAGLSAESLLGYFAIDTNRIAFNVGSDGNDPSGSLYYALATPTDTTITDQTLIAQLDAIRTASLQNGANTISNTATGSNLAGDMEIGYYGYNPRNRYDKWLWLDINNNYEQLGS